MFEEAVGQSAAEAAPCPPDLEPAGGDFFTWLRDHPAPPRPRQSPEEAEREADAFIAGLSAPRQPAVPQPQWGATVGDDGLPMPEPTSAEPGWGATAGDQAVPASPELAALQAAVEAVAAVDPADLAPQQALSDTRALLAALDALRLASLGRIADIETRQLHRLDGAKSATSWLRQQDATLTPTDVTLARRLPSLPTVAAALADRSLSTAAAARIGTSLASLRRWVDRADGLIDGQPAEQVLEGVIFYGVRDLVLQFWGGVADDDPRLHTLIDQLGQIMDRPAGQLARLEAAFVLLATHLSDDLLHHALGRLVGALLPNELERRARDAHDRRGFGLHPDPDGSSWRITDGECDPELGELLHTVLTAMLATDPEAVADTEAYRHARADGWTDADGPDGLTGPSQPTPRSLRQRRHDALKLALRRLLDSGALGSRGKLAPHIGVTTSSDNLHAAPGALPAVGDSGACLPRSLVRQWWCDSAVSRFVLSLGRKVIETSHTERTLKAHERRAKRIETGGWCQSAACRSGPGCALIPHHPDAWARSHTTSKDDAVMFCEGDHTALHNGATLRLRDGRLLDEHGWVQQ